MRRSRIKIGEEFTCIKDVNITGFKTWFTAGNIYISKHVNCLTNNQGVNTIVWQEQFNFNEYFKETNR